MKYPHEGGQDALILRLYETTCAPAETEVTLNLPRFAKRFSLHFDPSEIKTIRINKDGTVSETNLLEQ